MLGARYIFHRRGLPLLFRQFLLVRQHDMHTVVNVRQGGACLCGKQTAHSDASCGRIANVDSGATGGTARCTRSTTTPDREAGVSSSNARNCPLDCRTIIRHRKPCSVVIKTVTGTGVLGLSTQRKYQQYKWSHSQPLSQ
jgi:hypothetical protein